MVDIQKAQDIYETLIEGLEQEDWKFVRKDDELTIVSSYSGDELPIMFTIEVDPDAEVIRMSSPLPFDVKEETLDEVAKAICVANCGLNVGRFDLYLDDRKIVFVEVSSYHGAEILPDYAYHMMGSALSVLAHYNDLLLGVCAGLLTAKQLFEKE